MSDDVALNVKLPADLRERARKVAKTRRTSTTALIVEALTELVDAFEAKRRAEIDLRRREEDDKRVARRLALVLDDPEKLAPARFDPRAPADRDDDDEYLDHPLYVEHAERIRAKTDGDERRIAVREAVEAIVKQYPVTAPDHVILRRLEKILARLHGTPPRTEPLSTAKTATDARPSFLSRFWDGFGTRDSGASTPDPVIPVDDTEPAADGDE